MGLFKKKLPEVQVKVNSDELNTALETQRELVYFYQMGFLDCWICTHNLQKKKGVGRRKREIAIFARIEPKVREYFESRFGNQAIKQAKEKLSNG